MIRIQQLHAQISETAGSKGQPPEQKTQYKLDWFKNNGWGYKDTKFILEQDGAVRLTGSKYRFSNQKMMKFKEWAEAKVGIDLSLNCEAQVEIPADPPIINEQFVNAIQGLFNEVSFDNAQRILHSHGHTMQEIYELRHGKLARIVDCVIYISSHAQAEALVKLAQEHNVMLCVYGGGTNVTWALQCPKEERRMIVSVDMSRMNHVRSVDRKNMTALVEAGITGKDLEKELSRYGVVCGHEPDSVEFSTLGGWISTRASGMKKNRYGNIEDIVLSVKVVTPTGTLQQSLDYPRVSSGPDLNQIVLGSEGTLGIITEAVIKIKAQPEVCKYESILFHNFALGTEFMYRLSRSKVWPASVRLVDNNQFQFGMALKTMPHSKREEFMDKIKKYFVTQFMQFDPDQMCLVTVVFEGTKQEIEFQEKKVFELAKFYKGFRAGAENGERGYFLTYMIAYLRDFAMQFQFIAESFETAVGWKNVPSVCENIQRRIVEECSKRGVEKEPFVSFRISQVYDSGATIYVYFGFGYKGIADPVKCYSEIEDAAREEIMKNGGSISHHHGVGKLRKQFMQKQIGDTGVEILKRIKQQIDPKNIFGNQNLI
ncbi:unnamed protein product [Paramecium octaurelia]|uniref:Alkylglycerone-phosphate synthase n=1 Tax=Paramecium octaurelia TaxID=43137 RepID=A0A8S1V7B6_PAROT|nr:unnamed protein product [Paramecium octaurelia]